MTNLKNSQSLKRSEESVARLFSSDAEKSCLLLKSSSDIGVIRNGGRNGARFAPKSFLSTFKKFSQDHTLKEYSFRDVEVSDPSEEDLDFSSAQEKEARRIGEELRMFPDVRIIHLGGGHDHIYPLLLALSERSERIIVVNVDAHADTRTDKDPHSGTPFRQFAAASSSDFFLYQIGLHPFANSSSTLSPFEKGEMSILWRDDISPDTLDDLFSQIESKLTPKTTVVFSLDADALKASEVPGVSAVNPQGLSGEELLKIWQRYQKLQKPHEEILGIYELNPLYDSLAGISMRTLGSFVYKSFRSE